MDAGKHAAVKREVLSVWSKKAYVLNVNKRLQRHKPEGISLEQNEQSQLCPPTQPAPLDHHGKLQWLDPSIVINLHFLNGLIKFILSVNGLLVPWNRSSRENVSEMHQEKIWSFSHSSNWDIYSKQKHILPVTDLNVKITI